MNTAHLPQAWCPAVVTLPTHGHASPFQTMSSPARSTVSAASAGGGTADDVADSIDALYRKDEAMAELRSEVIEALQKEVRSLDDNSWMFAAPRSRINLISRPGGYLPKQQGKIAELGLSSKKTRNC